MQNNEKTLKNDPWWNKNDYQKRLPLLQQRAAIVKSIREFFDDQGFLAVETPALQISPGLEPHLQAFKTEILSVEQDKSETRYLHTSPEFAMKKILVAGVEKIYQIAHVFRNAEGSKTHSPEFTMIEWYRAGADYEQIMQDSIDLLRAVLPKNQSVYKWQNLQSDPFADWEKISVCQAFTKYAGIDLQSVLDNRDGFAQLCRQNNIHCAADDSWDDLFFRVFLRDIEPKLGHPVPTILYDYPVSMAALSRPKASDGRFAERFEIYVCGMELANAFGELTNAEIQLKRFEADMDLKEKLYGHRYPIDMGFIAALKTGLPECSGIALGVDRLVMLATHAAHIQDILWAPVE